MSKRRKEHLAKTRGSSAAAWWFMAVVLAFTTLVRIRLLAMPLERDEGEFGYMGQLILQGIPPYKLACNMKLPGTYAAYAAIMAVFGQSDTAIHIGLLLVNAASIILVFLLARRLFDSATAAIAGATYAMTSLSYGILGTQAHATHFVVLFALAGILLLLRALDTNRPRTFFLSGVLFGFAILMKQPGAFFLAFAVMYACLRLTSTRSSGLRGALVRLALLTIGGVLPFAVTCLILWKAGVWEKFWFWTVEYGRAYASEVRPGGIPHEFCKGISSAAKGVWPLWALGGLGLASLAWDKQVRAHAVFLLGLFAFGFAAASVGFYYRNHYFIMLLSAIALLAGCALSSTRRTLAHTQSAVLRLAPFVVFMLALCYPVYYERDFMFEFTPSVASRKLYGGNPFVETKRIGAYLRSHASPRDTVAVMGSEPQVYFYSRLHSATSHIYTYGLMENQPFALRMQNDMIAEIEAARPRYMVSVVALPSWCMAPRSHKKIFYWIEDYTKRHYERVGLVDMISPDQIVYHWDQDAASGDPVSDMYIEVYKRKPATTKLTQ